MTASFQVTSNLIKRIESISGATSGSFTFSHLNLIKRIESDLGDAPTPTLNGLLNLIKRIERIYEERGRVLPPGARIS